MKKSTSVVIIGIMTILEKSIILPPHYEKAIRSIVTTFSESGFECYLIGGSVRDLLMGAPAYDFDFATNARPQQVMKLFKRVIPTGIKHGTVSLLFNDDATYEITTYRADGKYVDGRRPESISFSDTLEEDVMRRDFTINGLAYDVIKQELIDYVGGLDDIDRRIIRTIGDSIDRFSEDGLRPYRACRFAAKLHFTIDSGTFDAIGKTLDVARLVSAERVRDELLKLLDADTPSVGFEYLRESGLLDLMIPELARCYGVVQNKYHMYDIYYHSIYSCDAAPSGNHIVRIAALLHDIGKVATRREGDDGDYTFYNHEVIGSRIAKKILSRLRFSNEEISRITNLISNHMFHYTDEWTDGAVRRFMRKVGVENIDDLFMVRFSDREGNGMRGGLPAPIGKLRRRMERVIEEENAITVKDLDIDGHVLMNEFSITPGPVIGKILNHLLELVLDEPEINERDILLEKAREYYNGEFR
ncbi:MAG TPA: CCA tRNA nucleotidyltransferase [Spirochaetota bacterium]|nr:CCA tRNA nucleotidyltransferase [Spirochaetota bacterium]